MFVKENSDKKKKTSVESQNFYFVLIVLKKSGQCFSSSAQDKKYHTKLIKIERPRTHENYRIFPTFSLLESNKIQLRLLLCMTKQKVKYYDTSSG